MPESWGRRLLGLAVILLVWSGVLMVKIRFDPVHYQTVDGSYYRELSQDFLSGRPMLLDDLRNRLGRPFSPYPPGFPVLLGISERFLPDGIPGGGVIPLHAFLLFLAGLVWIRFFPSWPFWFLIFSDGMLELACHTGSEFSFLMCLLLGIMMVYRLLSTGKAGWIFPILLFLMLAFQIRYAGVFVLPVLAWLVWKMPDQRRKLFIILGTLSGAMAFAGLWEWIVYGQLTGGDRYPNPESHLTLFHQLWAEVVDQFLVFRNRAGTSLPSFYSGLAAMALVAAGMRNAIQEPDPDSKREAWCASRLWVWFGLGYLAFIIPVRWYYYFAEPFDLRLLGPGFGLLVLGFFLSLEGRYRFRMRWWLPVYVLLAILFTLPKAALLAHYLEIFWGHTGPVFR